MAKSERKVTKGFGFYLLMLILMVVAAFLIIVCIMMFSPKMVILGYQYFSNNEENSFVVTTDESETTIDFASTSKIVVNCNNSQVSILKSEKVEKDEIILVNRTIGFAKWSDNVDMKYSIVYEGSILKIDVTEPQGFLHFSNDLQVVLRVPSSSDYDFANTEFDITTTTGSVIIGNTTAPSKAGINTTVDANDLLVRTGSGNITFTEYAEPNYNSVSLSTNSGSIVSRLDEMKVKDQMKMYTQNGNIRFKNFAFIKNDVVDNEKVLDLNLGNGKFNADTLNASLSFVTENGDINIKTIEGNLDGNETGDKINKATVNVNEIKGSVSLPKMENSDIKISKVGKSLDIETTTGNVSIGSLESGIQNSCWITTKSGNISVFVADNKITNNNDVKSHYFTTETGLININYIKSITSGNYVKSKTGNVEMKFGSDYKFILTFKNALGVAYEKLNNKINIDFANNETFTNPFVVNGYTGSNYFVDIATDGTVKATLNSVN